MTRDLKKSICLKAELESNLQDYADSRGISLPELISGVLGDFLLGQKRESRPLAERRNAVRHAVCTPAVVYTSGQDGRTERYRVAQMSDISTSGVGLRVASDREDLKEGKKFEILFQLAGYANPLRLTCTACRKAFDGTGLMIGAVFNEPVPGLGEHLSALA
jgi:hypothetical protein